MQDRGQLKTTLAEEALQQKLSHSSGIRKSNRRASAQRVKTSRLRRIKEIFWDNDSLYAQGEMHNIKDVSNVALSMKKFGSPFKSSPQLDENKQANGEALCIRTATPELNDYNPGTSSATEKTRIEHNFGGRMRLKKIHDSPHIFTIDNFLTEGEINKMQEKIGVAEKHRLFNKSFVDHGGTSKKRRKIKNNGNTITTPTTPSDEDEQTMIHNDAKQQRTSTFVHFSKLSDTTIAAIENRAAELLSLPNHSIEPLQLVRYHKGQYFNDHHDIGVLYEDGSVELPHKNAMTPPRRIVTILVYLNELSADCGGGTKFPLLGKGGETFSVRPRKGMALMWCNVTKDGEPDPRLVHSGETIKSDAIKYAMNIWACEE